MKLLILIRRCVVCRRWKLFKHFFYRRDTLSPLSFHRRCVSCCQSQEVKRMERKKREHEEYLAALKIPGGHQVETIGARPMESTPEEIPEETAHNSTRTVTSEQSGARRVRKRRRRSASSSHQKAS